MKHILTFTIVLIVSSSLYGAMVQFVHNAPTENLDIYIGEELQFSNIQFREGTPFILMPAGEWQLQIALANSNSVEDAFVQFTIFLEEDSNRIYMIGGEMEDLKLFSHIAHHFNADAKQHVGLTFVHAAIGRESINITNGNQSIIEDLKYGEFSDYISIPSDSFQVIIENNLDQEALISNRIYLHFWKDKSALIFTSGHIDDKKFPLKTYAILTNGVSFPLEEIPLPEFHDKVQVQLIQNSPSRKLDFYLENQLILDDFEFKQASPFLLLPRNEYFSLGFANENSRSAAEVENYLTLKLEEEFPYILFLNEEENTTSILPKIQDRIPENGFVSSVAIAFSQASYTLPAVDVYIDRNKIYEDIKLWEISDYRFLPSRPFRIDLTLAGQADEILYSAMADLSAWRGLSAMIYTSNPESTTAAINLQVVTSDSTFSLLPIDNTNNKDDIEARMEEDETLTKVSVMNGSIHIDCTLENAGEIDFMLLNMEAKNILQKEMGKKEIGKHQFDLNVDHLPAGIYLLHGKIAKKSVVHTVFIP